MSWLWDRTPSGDPAEDRYLVELEAHLSQYKRGATPPQAQKPRYRWLITVGIAAAILIAYFIPRAPEPSSWTRDGQVLALRKVYSASQEETVQVGSIGRLRFAKGARYRILESGKLEVLELLEGNFDALIIADPYAFRVVTAGARLDDLGCAYEVSVDKTGKGRVEVSLGWVRAHGAGEDSFIAQGYESTFAKGQAPTPPRKVSGAESGDPLDLVHRLWREKKAEDRLAAFDELAKLYPPPASVTRSRVERADRSVVRDYWPALPLGKEIPFPDGFASR